MFAQQISGAIDGARTLTRMDALARLLWQGHAAGAIDDNEAQRLAELLHAKKQIVRAAHEPVGLPPGRPSIFPPRKPQRAPSRHFAILRRRDLAPKALPWSLNCHFTLGQQAVLKIVGDQVRARGCCDLPLAQIAALAGVCRRLAQSAIREAASLGLLTVQERRQRGALNLTNVVRIISREWLAWLQRGPKRTHGHGLTGCKTSAPTLGQVRKRLHEEGKSQVSRHGLQVKMQRT